MNGVIFLGSLAAGIAAFELLDGALSGRNRTGRLRGVAADPRNGSDNVRERRTSAWTALLVFLLPARFGSGARGSRDVVDLLRRAGYPFATTGDFYAAAIRTFSIFLLIAGLAAGVVISAGAGLAPAVGTAGIFVLLGLRWPYARLRGAVRRRAEAFRSSMLAGLALLNALLSAGVSVQEAFRRTAGIGGPFPNLMGLLVAQMEVAPFNRAVEVVEAHLPDPRDVEAGLFLRAVRDFYNHNRPLLSSVQGLRESVHRELVETTESRAALVRQRSGLFGVLAVLGLVITIIAPFAAIFT
jgi:Flp pilus assembly protein TadB